MGVLRVGAIERMPGCVFFQIGEFPPLLPHHDRMYLVVDYCSARSWDFAPLVNIAFDGGEIHRVRKFSELCAKATHIMPAPVQIAGAGGIDHDSIVLVGISPNMAVRYADEQSSPLSKNRGKPLFMPQCSSFASSGVMGLRSSARQAHAI